MSKTELAIRGCEELSQTGNNAHHFIPLQGSFVCKPSIAIIVTFPQAHRQISTLPLTRKKGEALFPLNDGCLCVYGTLSTSLRQCYARLMQ